MIGGIFETIGKTLGIGKEKYFLELDDAAEEVASKAQKAATSAVKAAKEVSSDVVEKVQSAVDDAEDSADKAKANAKQAADKTAKTADKAAAKATDKAGKAAKKVDKTKDKAAAKVDKAAAKFNKKADKAIKAGDVKVKVSANEETGDIEATAIKTGKGSKPSDQTAEQVLANAAPDSTAAPSRDPDDIIREAIAATEKSPDGKPVDPEAVDTFSTDYLMPLGNRGRRRPGPSFSDYKNMARDTNPRLKS